MAKYFYSRDSGSAELDKIFSQLKGGDVLTVPSVDHLCTRWRELSLFLFSLESIGATLAVENQRGASIEGFRRDLRRAAVQRAKARGSYANIKGRPRKADDDVILELADLGNSIEAISAICSVSPRTVYRALQRRAKAAKAA
jgi:Homeodomain-like domain